MEEPAFERLEDLFPREGGNLLFDPLLARDAQVVAKRSVRFGEGIVQLKALEDVIVVARPVVGAELRVDRAADRPERLWLVLDPEDDAFLVALVVDPELGALGELTRW